MKLGIISFRPIVILLALSFALMARAAAEPAPDETPAAANSDSRREPGSFTEIEKNHWAFQKVRRPEPPQVKNSARVRNPIDAFVLAGLEARNIQPAPPADKITLIRRAYFDLVGLPPTPEEVREFLADHSSDAFDRLVDRLLSSPHYGERWARHWLDLARYAESEGFKSDETRPNAWRYRDYVIRSFNSDKPYDRFVQEQIAGDELWPNDPDARIATAFNRHYPDESNARNLRQRRQEILNDITDTVGSVFVGVTYACARCHDHKFDPILQKDYYRLQAFFANTAADDRIVLASESAYQQYRERLAVWEEKTRAIREEMAALEEPKRREIIKDYVDKYPPEIQTALAKRPDERNPFECQMVAKAMLYLDPKSHQYIAETQTVATRLKGDQKKRWEELNAQLKEFAHLHPGELPLGTGMTDLGRETPKTHLLVRGVYDAPKDEVEPGFLTILDPKPAAIKPLPGVNSTGQRAALASILTNPENPLPARVMVNRIWQYHFGRGIVETSSDLGLKGQPPSHPELLDWLASEFVRVGWSLKAMHRLIMSSSVYQQASRHDELAARADPENKWLWKFPRQRLEAEVIRDTALAVAGLLNPVMGGPSVFPELPTGMGVRGGWKLSREESDRNRRSIYVFVRRNTRYPLFESFDMPDTHESCSRRNITTSPLQALNLLNSELALKWARHFATRVLELSGNQSLDKQIHTAYQLAFSRDPSVTETESIQRFFNRQNAILKDRAAAGEALVLPSNFEGKLDPAEAASLVDFCHMLINANEFVYRN